MMPNDANLPHVNTRNDRITLNLDTEYLLARLFGLKNKLSHQDRLTLAEWKQVQLRVIHALRRSVTLNLQTDRAHHVELSFYLDSLECSLGRSKTIHDANEAAFVGLTTIAFLLLGEIPNNRESRSVSNPSRWATNHYRTAGATQSISQIAAMFMRSEDHPATASHHPPSYLQLLKDRHELGLEDDLEFIAWFMDTHADVYLALR